MKTDILITSENLGVNYAARQCLKEKKKNHRTDIQKCKKP